ncbi:hypothetical protein GJU43_16390 [Flavobacterium sp. LC2016-23]|uniref:hypothetical protein n=1 Tax=Flavobacterium sp. LC2016-23 TaxID=2666330 RepID=UPI0012B06F0E|nr:hypothetical protein [Flavobacterium sp. LC2016-23]MRX40869.1 hypothetical protein [Flavobacterium sp. LC2016-23]
MKIPQNPVKLFLFTAFLLTAVFWFGNHSKLQKDTLKTSSKFEIESNSPDFSIAHDGKKT